MWNSFKNEKLMSFSNIFVIAISLLFLGIFILIIAWTQTAIRSLEKQAQVTIFFKDDFVEENILKLQETLTQDVRIDSITYISKTDALNIFTELNKDDPILLEAVSADILPASLEIKTKDISDLETISEEFSQLEGVEEVKFYKDIISRFRTWSRLIYIGGFSLVGVFMIISFSVIIISLRITINSKKGEIEILKLVGASDEYIQNPLLKQGMLYGLIGGLIAAALILLTSIIFYFGGIRSQIEFGFLPNLKINPLLFSFCVDTLLIILGFTLGYLGSLVAIKKYLK